MLIKNGQTAAFAFVFIGTISAVYLVLSGVLSIPFGALCDRFGRKTMAAVGCIIGAIGLFGLAVAGEIPGTISYIFAISSVLILLGVGHSSYTASALAYTGDISTESNVGKAYGVVETAEYVSFSYAGFLGTALIVIVGFEWTFVLSAVMILIAGAVAWIGMPELRIISAVVPTPSDSGSVLAQSEKISRDQSTTKETNQDSSTPAMKKIWSKFAGSLKNPRILISLFSMLLISLGIQVFRNFIPLYSGAANVPSLLLLSLSSVVAGSGLLAALPIGVILDKTKRYVLVLVAGLLLASLSFWVIFIYPTSINLVLWSVIFGVAVSMTRVPQAVVIAEDTTRDDRATAMGTDHAFEHAGYGLGAITAGFLISDIGFAGAFQTYAVVMLLGGLVILGIYQWKKYK